MSLVIELLTHKPAASFRKSTKIGQKLGIKSSVKLYSVKCAINDIYDVYPYFDGLLALLIETLSSL